MWIHQWAGCSDGQILLPAAQFTFMKSVSASVRNRAESQNPHHACIACTFSMPLFIAYYTHMNNNHQGQLYAGLLLKTVRFSFSPTWSLILVIMCWAMTRGEWEEDVFKEWATTAVITVSNHLLPVIWVQPCALQTDLHVSLKVIPGAAGQATLRFHSFNPSSLIGDSLIS